MELGERVIVVKVRIDPALAASDGPLAFCAGKTDHQKGQAGVGGGGVGVFGGGGGGE